MKKTIETIIKNIDIPTNPQHKAQLKHALMKKAQNQFEENGQKTNSWKIFQWGFAFLSLIAIVLSTFNLTSTPEKFDYLTFIEKAKAYAEANRNKVHYYKIRTENIDLNNNTHTIWSEAEIWRSEDGSQLSKNILFDEIALWEKEGGFKPVPSISLLKKDTQGNEYIYSKLQQVGTEEIYDSEGIKEVPLYSVHPEKQLDKQKELEKLSSTTYCINFAENDDLKGISIAKISDNNEILEVQGQNIPKNKRYRILGELGSVFEGNLSKIDLLNILDDYKDSPFISHKYSEEEGKNYYIVSLNVKDFSMVSSSSPEGLQNMERPDIVNTFYFNADTFTLEKIEIWDKLHSQKNILTYEDQYIENINEEELFNDKGFVLISLTSNFEKKIQNDPLHIASGCYKNAALISQEEANKYINILNEYLKSPENNNTKQMWENTLSIDPYYYLPE